MGGKTSTSTQTVSIPPEVLARYNSVNQTAEQAASAPFTQYSTDPNAFVAPLTETQLAGIANTNATAGMTAPYYEAATNVASGASNASLPYYGAATGQINAGLAAGQAGTQQSLGTLSQANQASQPYLSSAGTTYGNAYAAAQPFNSGAQSFYTSGLNQGAGGLGQAGQTLEGANVLARNPLDQAQYSVLSGQSATQPYIANATQGINAALQATQPYNNLAGGLYGAGVSGAMPHMQQAGGDINAATGYIDPYNSAATRYAAAGAQAVNPDQLDIQRYMSPYLNTVLQGTAGLLNQNNQQQMAGQLGNAVRSGAFGGDRAGIAAANLAQQQQLANASIYSNILNQGYGQALGTAQQQQGVGLGAAQANRAALQNASNQMLGIGQAGFGENLATSQQRQALGQGIAGLMTQAGQNYANLGQQQYGQQLGAAQQQAALANQIYGMGANTAQIQGGLAGQQYQFGANTAAQQAAMANSLYGMNAQTGAGVAGIGNQIYAQGMGLGQAQQGLGAQLFGQGAQTAQQQAQAAQQMYGQQIGAATANAGLGGQLYGQGANLAALYGQLGSGAQAAALQSAQAQLGAGTAAQQTQQAGLSALYNQFLQQQSYPFQTAQFLANIAEGTGSLSGSTTTTQQPGGFFSDRRLKEGVKKVGRTFDGQDIVTFRYKGEPETRMGLIAQDVEKKHPEAVGLASGFKTVDYGKATEDAAERAPRASGGLVGRESYDYGGFVVPGYDPNLMAEILHGQQASFGAPSGGLGGVPGGGSGRVPAANLPVHQLQTAGALPQQPSAISEMNSVAELGKNIGDIGRYFSKDKDLPSMEDPDADVDDGKRYGGLVGYAPGGAVQDDSAMPYKSEQTGPDLNIPDTVQDYKLATAPGGPMAPDSGLSKVGKAAGAVKGIIGAGKAIASLFSDERLKENIKPIGKTFDGQTVYSYNFKGDHRTEIGLIAQDVEKKHPKAVGSVNGYKTVDYARAVKRAKKAAGGALDTEDFGPTDEDKKLLDTLSHIAMPPNSDGSSAPVVPPPVTATEPPPAEPKDAAPSAAQPDMPVPAKPQTRSPGGKEPVVRSPGKGNRPTRNNNPGNITAGAFTKKMPGYLGSDGRFAVFDTPEHGKAAQQALLRSYIARGINTPFKIASTWAPGSEKGNNPSAYATAMAQGAGIGVHDRVPMDRLGALAAAQARVEGWSEPRARKTGGRAGYALDGSVDDPDEEKRRQAETAALLLADRAQNEQPLAPVPAEMAAVVPTDEHGAPVAANNAAGRQAVSNAFEMAMRPLQREPALAPREDTPPEPAAPPPAAPGLAGAASIVGDAGAPPADAPPEAPVYTEQPAPAPTGLAVPDVGQAHRGSITDAGKYYEEHTRGHGFFGNLKRGKADAVLSLLTGLAAMGTAPTRSFGVALAAGLGAGAKTYQGQREYQEKLAQQGANMALKQQNLGNTGVGYGLSSLLNPGQAANLAAQAGLIGAQTGFTGAQTAQTRAGTARTQALMPFEVQKLKADVGLVNAETAARIATGSMVIPTPDPDTGQMTYQVFNPVTRQAFTIRPDGSMAETAPVGGAPVAPAAPTMPGGASVPSGSPLRQPAPAGAPPRPAAPATGAWRPDTSYHPGDATSATSEYTPAGAGIKSAAYTEIQRMGQQAAAANTKLAELRTLEQQAANIPKSGLLSQGSGASWRAQVARDLNAYGAVVLGQPIIDPNTLGAYDTMEKFTNVLGFNMAHAMGANRNAASIVQTAISTNPGVNNTPIGFRRLVSAMREAARYEADRAAYYTSYWQHTNNIAGAEQKFSARNPPEMYAVRAIMNTVDRADAAALRKDPSLAPSFDRVYGHGVSRYFLGR